MNKFNVDNGHITELKDACTMYFNLFALFFKESCNSTVWTIGYVVPYTLLYCSNNTKLVWALFQCRARNQSTVK